ncbi:FAD-dependent oxidoreductase [Ruegeria denitrificans]|uniref:FAD-dependent oxidoreductase n=1 Tax=Ruegeria denitrificans TaxID=1715692 RepID=UPI003C7975AB
MRIPEYGASRWLIPDFHAARHVIVGGGIIGCAVAYHQTGKGHRDVVRFEHGQLSRGITWCAAGLVGQLCSQPAMTNLIRRSPGLHCPAGLSPLNRCRRNTGQALVEPLHARAKSALKAEL